MPDNEKLIQIFAINMINIQKQYVGDNLKAYIIIIIGLVGMLSLALSVQFAAVVQAQHTGFAPADEGISNIHRFVSILNACSDHMNQDV